MPKMHQNRFRGQALPGPTGGSLSATTGLPIRNRGGPTSKGRDVSIDWSQDRTTSLKYKAQWKCRVPNSSYFFLWRINTENSSSCKHWKRCKFMPKMHQNTFGGWASSEPAGGAKRFQTP